MPLDYYSDSSDTEYFLAKYPKSTTNLALQDFKISSQDLKEAGTSKYTPAYNFRETTLMRSSVESHTLSLNEENIKTTDFICETCQKKFGTKKDLKLHSIRIHCSISQLSCKKKESMIIIIPRPSSPKIFIICKWNHKLLQTELIVVFVTKFIKTLGVLTLIFEKHIQNNTDKKFWQKLLAKPKHHRIM